MISDYYDAGKFACSGELLEQVDKIDAAQLTQEDILDSQGWVLLGFVADPRTGLGYYQNFRSSNLEYYLKMVEMVRTMTIDQIMAHPDTVERTRLYFENTEKAKTFYKNCSWTDGPIVISDFRIVGTAPPGNRFLVYSLYSEANISIRIMNRRTVRSSHLPSVTVSSTGRRRSMSAA